MFRPIPIHPNSPAETSNLRAFATTLDRENSVSKVMGEGFDSLRIGNIDFRMLLEMVAAGRFEIAIDATTTVTSNVKTRELDPRPLSNRVLAIESVPEETNTIVSLTYTEVVTTTRFDATRERTLVGNISLSNGANYSIRYRGNGQHIIRRTDSHFDHFMSELSTQQLRERALQSEAFQPEMLQTHDATANLPAPISTPSQITMAIFYTPQVASLNGGMVGVLGLVNDCLRQANDAMSISQAYVLLTLSHLSEVNYIERRNEGLDGILEKLIGNRIDPQIPIRRKFHRCDLALMIVNKPTNGGFTQLLTRDNASSSLFAPMAYSVVDDSASNLVGYYTFAHEVGHFFGCHDKDASLSKSLCPCARGHDYTTVSGKKFATLMNYSMAEEDRVRCLRYSNPSVFHDGVATGLSGTNDHAYLINRTRGLIQDLSNHLP